MLIKNGILISPGTHEQYRADILIEAGQISEIRRPAAVGASAAGCQAALPEEPGISKDETVIDAGGCVVAPGLIDVHVHFRDPGQTWKEDLHTGSLAAAAGGFTTVVCMANTRPPVDCTDVLSSLVRRAKEEQIRVRFTAAVTKGLQGRELTDFEALAAAGACGFTDDGIPLLDEKLVEQAMLRAKALDLPLSFHEEHPSFIEKPGTHRTAPSVAEDILVARDCMLALHTGAAIDIQHISSANSVALVRTAIALGARVSAEASPHHFTLTQEAVRTHGTFAKMNPPLRTEADRQAIIRGLADGTIGLIATDHAPHSTEEKQKEDFFSAPSGIIGLETSLALGVTELVRKGHLTLMQLLERMTSGPAKLYGFDSLAEQSRTSGRPLYGSIAPGCAADLVIFCPEETFIAGNYRSKSENTPFTGRELYGKIHYTICGGRIVYRSE